MWLQFNDYGQSLERDSHNGIPHLVVGKDSPPLLEPGVGLTAGCGVCIIMA